MPLSQPSRRRTGLRLLPVGALLALGLLMAACAPSALPPTAAPPQIAPTASIPVANPTPASVTIGDVPVGVDAAGNFYRGDPNAPVKLEEFSEFQ